MTAHTNSNHANIKAMPPAGVTAPGQRTLVILRIYRLPENRMIPAAINPPAHLSHTDWGMRAATTPIRINPNAW